MTSPPDPPPPIEWTPEGAPRAPAFDDIYFQPGEGLAETRTVFLEGCGLPEAWRGRSHFVVAELGFGTGLNILALLDLWRRSHAPGQRLHIFSIEAYPISADDAARALAAFPELDVLAALLLAAWPRRVQGFHRIELAGLDAVLDLAVGDAAQMLQAWSGGADAWFLDGFSPAKNPLMWSDEVFRLVAARSAPGARLGTFTVAGAVRRGLAAAGFTVDKRPGHGRKRERLEGRLEGAAPPSASPGRIAIVGGGIAGAALARAAAALGLDAVVIAASEGAAGASASANPAALVTPFFDAGAGAGARLSTQAFFRAIKLYDPQAVIARGVLQIERDPRDQGRFDTLAASSLFEAGELARMDPAAVAAHLDEPAGPGGLMLPNALVVEPASVIGAWLSGAGRITGQVRTVERDDGAWRLIGSDGEILAEAETVWLAAGAGLIDLGVARLQIVRGQATWASGFPQERAAAGGAYAAPTRDGMLFGATHDRDDAGLDLRPEDDARNLASLAKIRPRLAQAMAGRPLQSRAGLRAAASDYQPVAGRAPGREGLFILGGLGGRGFTAAPLLAEHVAALSASLPSPLPMDLAAIVDPARKALSR